MQHRLTRGPKVQPDLARVGAGLGWNGSALARLPMGGPRFARRDDFEKVNSDADVLEWIRRTAGGASGEKPRWPGGATTGEGLAKIIDQRQRRREGVHFSRPIGLPAPTNANTLPTWEAVNNRMVMRNTTPLDQLTMDNIYVPGGMFISTSTAPIKITNSIFDRAGTGTYHALLQNLPGISPIEIRNCDFYGYLLTCGGFYNGTYADCYFHDTQGDAIWFPGAVGDATPLTGPKRLYRNFARRLGQINPVTHADGLQTSGKSSDIITFGNMIYMPASTGIYNEESYGTTNCMNYNTDQGDLSEILSVNDCLIGGGYTVSLCPDAGDQLNGAAFVGTWFSKPYSLGGEFTAYASFYPGAPSIGLARNILIHNCRHLEDGSPIRHNIGNFGGTEAQGLWEYDKTVAPARFKQVCQMLGYTDWNDDPLVTVRTGFHSGTVTITLSALTGSMMLAENAVAGAVAGALGGTTYTSTLSLTDDAGGRVALSGTNVVRGTTGLDYEAAASHSFTVRETFAAAGNSPRDTVFSLTVTDVDEIPPTLSSPTATATGGTTATVGVTTDEGNGTLYWFVSTSATPPSVANLKAGTGAVASGTQAISSTGAKAASVTGLTNNGTYYAHFLHRDAAGNDSAIASSASFSTGAATQYFAAMSVAPDATRQGHLTTLIDGLIADGVWAKLDWLSICAAHDEQAGRINAVNPSQVATAPVAPTFTTDRGFTGNGTTQYLNSGWNPLTASSPKLTQNNGHMGAWLGTDVNAFNQCDVGQYTRSMIVGRNGSNLSTYPNATSAVTGALPVATSVGHGMWCRSASNACKTFKNGAVLSTSAQVSAGFGNYPFNICAGTNPTTGAIQGASTRRVQAVHWGSNLSDAEAAALYSRLATYMTAVGA